MAPRDAQTGIIWANEASDVILIDIPMSIANAQVLPEQDTGLHLVSCEPPSEPFNVPEPKTAKAFANVRDRGFDAAAYRDNVEACRLALACIHSNYSGHDNSYCFDRVVDHASSTHPPHSRKRKSLENQDGQPTDENKEAATFEDYCLNDSDEVRVESTWDITEARLSHVRIPPQSAVLLGKCEDTRSFRAAARDYLSDDRQRGFNFILLDPPWPNASARRQGSYRTNDNLRSIRGLLLGLDLDQVLLPGGCIAVWVTNRPTFRELVLGSGGLFEAWNCALEEEWIWLKVTKHGEPMTPIEGTWRKPYEVLLIGRSPLDRLSCAEQRQDVSRRVFVGVPDLHSRKPCLKESFEKHLLHSTHGQYRGLEVFARCAISGWFAWGDEASKFNDESFWRPV